MISNYLIINFLIILFYRVRDFWLEQGPADVLAKLQRKELTLFRAAEILNVTVTTLANYLSTMRQGDNLLAETATVSAIERSTFRDVISESDIGDESDDNSIENENIVKIGDDENPQDKSMTFISTSNLNGN